MMVIFARETLSDEMSEDSGHWLGTASAEAQWSCAQNGDCVSMCGARCVEQCSIAPGDEAADAVAYAQECLRPSFVRGTLIIPRVDDENSAECESNITDDADCFIDCEANCADEYRGELESSSECIGVCASECQNLLDGGEEEGVQVVEVEEEGDEQTNGEEEPPKKVDAAEDHALCSKLCSVISCPAANAFHVYDTRTGSTNVVEISAADLKARHPSLAPELFFDGATNESGEVAIKEWLKHGSDERTRIAAAMEDPESVEFLEYRRFVDKMQQQQMGEYGGGGFMDEGMLAEMLGQMGGDSEGIMEICGGDWGAMPAWLHKSWDGMPAWPSKGIKAECQHGLTGVCVEGHQGYAQDATIPAQG